MGHRISRRAYCYEKPVLIDNVEKMEGRKTFISSLVRFQRFDHVHSGFTGSLYFSFQTGLKFLDTG